MGADLLREDFLWPTDLIQPLRQVLSSPIFPVFTPKLIFLSTHKSASAFPISSVFYSVSSICFCVQRGSRPTAANRARALLGATAQGRQARSASDSGAAGFRREMEMDGPDQPQPQPSLRVSSPPATAGVMMPQHAYVPAPAMPPGSANVMQGMPLAFNPMASPAASSAMKPADMPVAIYRPDSGPPGMQQQPGSGGAGAIVISGSGGELVKKKRGRPRKYGPDGTLGMGPKPAAGAASEAGRQSGGAGSNSNPDGKRRGRPPGSGKKKQLDALGKFGCIRIALNSQIAKVFTS